MGDGGHSLAGTDNVGGGRVEWRQWWQSLRGTEKSSADKKSGKINWTWILLGLGVIFLFLSNTFIAKDETGAKASETSEKQPVITEGVTAYKERLTEELEEIFSHMAGVGRTEVLLVWKDGGELSVLQDQTTAQTTTEEQDASGGYRHVESEEKSAQTVTDAGEDPFVVKETAPTVQGILIVAEGAESAVICQQIIEAVQALLGLPITNIHVAPYQK